MPKPTVDTVVDKLKTGAAAASEMAAKRRMRSVQVQEGQVRAEPSFLSKITARLAYGDQVEVTGEQGAWSKITLPKSGAKGWIHTSALSKKEIELSAGATSAEQLASSNELALAGKGFNAEVEGEFKAKNKSLDYTWVDRMEKFQVTQEQMLAFLREGGLPASGGVK